MKVKFGLLSHCLMFCRVPLLRLSKTETLIPLVRRASTRWLPTKPAPPITSACILFPKRRVCLSRVTYFLCPVRVFSFFIISKACSSFRGLWFSRVVALFSFSDESFGLLAFHFISFIVMVLIRFLFRLKVSASFRANSYLFTFVATAVCVVPVIFRRL